LYEYGVSAADRSRESKYIRRGFRCELGRTCFRCWCTHAPKSASKACQSPPSATGSGRISGDWIWISRQLISENRVNPVLGHSTPD